MKEGKLKIKVLKEGEIVKGKKDIEEVKENKVEMENKWGYYLKGKKKKFEIGKEMKLGMNKRMKKEWI